MTSPIARDLQSILTMTVEALSKPFTLTDCRALLGARKELVEKVLSARAGGAPFGAEEEALVQKIAAMDRQAIDVVRSPHVDAFAWLAKRDADREAKKNSSQEISQSAVQPLQGK